MYRRWRKYLHIRILKSFARMQEEFPLNKLVLFDIDGERQKPIGQYGEIMFKERYPELISLIQQILPKLIKTWTLSSCRCVQADFTCVKKMNTFH